MLMQQWQYLNLTRNSFYTLLPAKGIMSYRQVSSSCLYICLKELVHLLANRIQRTLIFCLHLQNLNPPCPAPVGV